MIGIDARKVRDFGIGRYLEGLLRGLAELDGPERYRLFVRPGSDPLPPALSRALSPERFSLTPLDAEPYSLRELFAFRGAATRFGLTLMHYPHYVRPFWVGCPTVVTVHDAIHLSHPPSAAARVYAELMLRRALGADCVLTVSAAARDDLELRLGAAPGQVQVTPNGVESTFAPPPPEAVDEFRRRRQLGRYVLCVASHRPHKNLAAAARAFAAADLKDHELVVPARDEATAADLRDVAADARLLIGVPDDELPLAYAAADFVFVPSLAEGFGLPLLEAMACGAPTLAVGIPSHLEIAADAAELLPDGTVPTLTAGLRSLASDAARREHLRRRGPVRAAEFTWDRTADLTRSAYRATVLG